MAPRTRGARWTSDITGINTGVRAKVMPDRSKHLIQTALTQNVVTTGATAKIIDKFVRIQEESHHEVGLHTSESVSAA